VLPILLLATAFLGVGFGLAVPALNTLTAAFHPDAVETSVLVLNALLGLGTALAPVLVALFVGLGAWWALPIAVGGLLAALIVLTLSLSLAADDDQRGVRMKSSGQFWLFAGFALLYGVVETLNGNWAILYMKGVLRAGAGLAATALTLFWAAATAGRVLFAGVERWLPARTTFRLLPWVIALAFVSTALLPSSMPELGPAAFALAGLGCSGLLPLTVSLGRRAAPAGALIACYQVGYGVAAFGVGPLHDGAGVGMRTLFGAATAIALALAALAALIVHQTTADSSSPRVAG
jgi:predicted MFS family arabinose efflux permease